MANSAFPTGFGQPTFADSTAMASVWSTSEPTALRDSSLEPNDRLVSPSHARKELWAVLIALAGFWLIVAWTLQSVL
jgi:hypothetical protein